MTTRQLKSQMGKPLSYLKSARDKWLTILISGIFCSLFLLYFKPFGITNYDPNFQIDLEFVLVVFFAGLVMMLSLAFTEFVLRPIFIKNWTYANAILWFVVAMVFVSSAIFLQYNWLGNWHDLRLSSYLNFIPNVSLIGAFSVGALVLYFEYKGVKSAYVLSLNDREALSEKIQFSSENQKEQLVLGLDQLLYLESEDNYVAIYFYHNDKVEKVLIRNSLKGVLNEVENRWLLQCHRSFLVNLNQVIHVSGNNHGLELKLNHLKKPLPVSRKYVAEIREKLEALDSHP